MGEQIIREVNRRIVALMRSFGGLGEYLCECGHVACHATRIELDLAEIEAILASSDTLVAPGHETPGTEPVRHGKGYVVVRASEQFPHSARLAS